jgi:prepilin-type processing-associated H-X9-DG protein
MRRERVSTNFGWAVFTLRAVSKETGIFTCPNDNDPKPIPALLVKVDAGAGGQGGTTSTDGIFNRYRRVSETTWRTDVQDLMDTTVFGGDAAGNPNDIDLLFEYTVPKGADTASVMIAQRESALDFTVYNHKGQTIWPRASAAVGQRTNVPIIWMSYAANAAAGLKSVRGNPILLTEAGKPGVFPFDLVRGTTTIYPKDNPITKALRLRHGGRNPDPILRGWDYTSTNPVAGVQFDFKYLPRERMNTGFYDGHVERIQYKRLLGTPTGALWRGTSGTGELSYD